MKIILLLISFVLARLDIQSCITHPETTELDITVEEHQISRDSMEFNSQDQLNYLWRYEIYFHNPGVNCSIQGENLKIYIHDSRGGLGIDGLIFRNNYTSNQTEDVFPFYPWEL